MLGTSFTSCSLSFSGELNLLSLVDVLWSIHYDMASVSKAGHQCYMYVSWVVAGGWTCTIYRDSTSRNYVVVHNWLDMSMAILKQGPDMAGLQC